MNGTLGHYGLRWQNFKKFTLFQMHLNVFNFGTLKHTISTNMTINSSVTLEVDLVHTTTNVSVRLIELKAPTALAQWLWSLNTGEVIMSLNWALVGCLPP